MYVAWPTGVQLLVFFYSSVSVGCSTPQGSPGVGRNTFLSSPHLCFIIVFICDSFVSHDDPLMSKKTFMRGRMWDLIISVPDHCLSFYFLCGPNNCMF